MPATAGVHSKSKAEKDEVTEPIPSAFSEEEEEESDKENEDDDDDEEVDSDEEEEGVLLSELDSDAEGSDIDIVPYQKLHKDNHAALTQALSTFSLPLASLPFHIHQSITSSSLDEIDVNDDLNRELAFYKQALDAVQQGRKQLLEEGIPFSRPADYFAEMVKDDEHMDKVSSLQSLDYKTICLFIFRSKNDLSGKKLPRKLLKQPNVNAILKNSENQFKCKNSKTAKKRNAQHSIKSKSSRKVTSPPPPPVPWIERIVWLMEERQDGTTLTTEDDFDVELDNAVNEGRRGGGGIKSKMTRENRNEKYGFGGNVRKRKRDDGDVWDTGSRGGGRGGGRGGRGGGRGGRGAKRGGPQRPGKQRRQQQRN
jgi:rRNA-processing protein EBP2